MGFFDRLRAALSRDVQESTDQRQHQRCSYCGKRSDEPYTNSEWNARERMCEECEYAEMADGTLW
ncbi:hypothetical protein [Methanocalculus sp.]|uniref:hypothetical protein n=1 Tax=Methanocalculus sp. TaxID=2004547 RepID=UPI0027196D0F|nr:hypothetical protein [Methanocalculus sp.]MDO8840684.1 hypothetical protein [Methanocalculus sp.]